MENRINPYFSIKPGIHEECHQTFKEADSKEQAVMAAASELAVLCQQERAVRHADRVRRNNIEAASVQAGLEKFCSSRSITVSEWLENSWPSMFGFLEQYWAQGRSYDALADFAVSHEPYKGTNYRPERATGLAEVAYDMAEDWAKRMQIHVRSGQSIAECAEPCFLEAFKKSGSDNLQMVRIMAAQYLQRNWGAEKTMKDEFVRWFATHREAPPLPFDRKCRHSDVPAISAIAEQRALSSSR